MYGVKREGKEAKDRKSPTLKRWDSLLRRQKKYSYRDRKRKPRKRGVSAA
jgi:hypothetical protein